MATRQYIGARYVPKFYQNSVDGSTQWESNVVYDPLIYVTLQNGHMYISKKQVPATIGTPASNVDYWLDVGSYDGFIEQLQGEIDTINEVTIPALQGDIALKQDITDSSLTTTATTIVGAINELNSNKQDKTDNNFATTSKTVVGAVNELDGDISSLNTKLGTKLDKIPNRRFLFIGDSYDTIVTNYSWTDIAADKLGVTDYVKRSSGGKGFDPVSGTKWIDYLTANPVTNPETITDIVIGGGTNDSTQTEANVRAAMVAFNTYIGTTFPNCERVYLGYMGWSHLNASQKTQHRTMMAVYLEGAKALGWNFLNGVQYILRNPKYIIGTLADRVHPNADGVTQLGECVSMAIKDGMAEIRVVVNTEFTPNSAKVTGSAFTIGQTIYNGNIEFTTPDLTLTAADDLSSYFTLASCPDLGSPINQYKYWMTYVAFGGNIYPAVLVSLNPNELTLWLRGGVTIPNGTSFQVGGFTYNDLS